MFAMLISLIGQDGGGGLDFIWLLVPLLCCMLLMGQRGEGSQSAGLISDSFYTRHDIQEAFDNVEEEVSRWRADAEGRPSPGGILAVTDLVDQHGTESPVFPGLKVCHKVNRRIRNDADARLLK